MTETADVPAAPAAGRTRRGSRRPSRVTVPSVLGELLITAGLLVLLFLAWQLWWNDMVMAGTQSEAAQEISRQWVEEDRAIDHPDAVAAADTPGEPVVAVAPPTAEPIAVLYVPRFGLDYQRTIAEGVGTSVLNSTRLGIGHYPGTQMPGEIGNFAIAAHRSAYGGGMHLINELRVGDPIYVQTPDGYYTYRFRDLNYVPPTSIDVIAPVPGFPGAAPTDRIITLTSCNPLYSTDERIIAHGVFESWQPTSAGAPTELAAIIDAQAQS
jgi:sortase A